MTYKDKLNKAKAIQQSRTLNGLNPRGDWREGSIYTPQDLVHYEDKTYICINATSEGNPSESPDFVLFAGNGKDGISAKDIEIGASKTHIQWRYVGSPKWYELAPLPKEMGPRGYEGKDGLPGKDGVNGKQVQLRKTEEAIEWRYEGGTWIVLVKLEELKGPKGNKGDDGENGKSAYEIWLEEGNRGSKQQFLSSLKGSMGYPRGGGGGSLQNVIAGTNITIDYTDPRNPVISSTGGGGGGGTWGSITGTVTNQTDLVEYVEDNVSTSRKAGSASYRAKGMDNYFAALENRGTTPVDIVIIGDSISIANCIGGEASFPFVFGNLFNQQYYNHIPRDGWRTASGNDPGSTTTLVPGGIPGLLTNAGTPVSTGSGGYSTTMTNGQQATYTTTMAGVSVIYSTAPTYGSLEVRDGLGGTLLGTITTTGAAKAGNVWTSAAITSASHTIEITSVGNNKLEALYAHLTDRASGVRVWNLGHSGWKTSDFLADSSTYLDFIDNMNPDLVVIATGTNDTSAATYTADVATLISNIQGVTTTDFAFWVPYLNANFTAAKMNAIRSYIATNDYPSFDSAAMLNDEVFTGTRWQGFGVHPNVFLAAAIARQQQSLLSGDPINSLEKAMALKADKWNAYFTGTTQFAAGKIGITDFLSYPLIDLYASGTYSQLGLMTHSFGSLFGLGAGISFGIGSVTADTILFRSGVNQLSLNNSTGTLAGNLNPTINAQTGTTYTLVLNDAGKQITRSNGSASTQDVPSNSTAAIPIGTVIHTLNIGAGTVTVQAGSGATLVGDTSLAQNKLAILRKISTNGWHSSIISSTGTGASTALDNLAAVAINAALVLATSDAFALGSATKMWSDLFLASGAVINFNNGNAAITHNNAGTYLLVAPGDLRVTSANVGTNADSVPTLSSTSTMTNKTFTSPVINTGVSGTAVDTDGTLAANSDTKLASQKAVKTYVDGAAPAFDNASNIVANIIFGG